MKSNKGFTLIELLAVIVILAIIALIATPVILNIINDSRDNAKQRSAELVVSSVRTAYATAYMKDFSSSTTTGNEKSTSGQVPYLKEVASELITQLDNAIIADNSSATASAITNIGNTADSTLVVTTNDGVVCTFTLSSGGELSLTDGNSGTTNTKCGDIVASKTAVKIGKLAVKPATTP